MENKKIEQEIKDWTGQTESFVNNLSSFIENISKEMSPEQKKQVQSELNGLDLSDLKMAKEDMKGALKDINNFFGK